METKIMGPIIKEESFAQRRELFKGIWDTAMQLGSEKDGSVDDPVTSKPKVIKTLRLDDIDRSLGRKKKQRIKNLRSVCNKILDFCNLQENEDLFYEQIIADNKVDGQGSQKTSKTEHAPLKQKAAPLKKKTSIARKSLSNSPTISKEVRKKNSKDPDMKTKTSNVSRKKTIIDQIETSENISEEIKMQQLSAESKKDWKRLSNEDRIKINKKAAGIGRSLKMASSPRRIRKRKIVIPVTSFSFSGRRRTRNIKKKSKKSKEDAFSLSGPDGGVFGASSSKKPAIPVLSV